MLFSRWPDYRRLKGASTRWIEPPWKAIPSNKGILPLLWAMFPGHPNLLPAYFDDDDAAASLGACYVRKPLYSREGTNVTLVSAGNAIDQHPGPYGAEGAVHQALAPLPEFSGQYPVLGSWIVDGAPVDFRSAKTTIRSRATCPVLYLTRFYRLALEPFLNAAPQLTVTTRHRVGAARRPMTGSSGWSSIPEPCDSSSRLWNTGPPGHRAGR